MHRAHAAKINPVGMGSGGSPFGAEPEMMLLCQIQRFDKWQSRHSAQSCPSLKMHDRVFVWPILYLGPTVFLAPCTLHCTDEAELLAYSQLP
jgi:hypothetical protein